MIQLADPSARTNCPETQQINRSSTSNKLFTDVWRDSEILRLPGDLANQQRWGRNVITVGHFHKLFYCLVVLFGFGMSLKYIL